MADTAIDVRVRTGVARRLLERLRASADRRAEHRAERREIRAWLNDHPPSLGRSTGAKV